MLPQERLHLGLLQAELPGFAEAVHAAGHPLLAVGGAVSPQDRGMRVVEHDPASRAAEIRDRLQQRAGGKGCEVLHDAFRDGKSLCSLAEADLCKLVRDAFLFEIDRHEHEIVRENDPAVLELADLHSLRCRGVELEDLAVAELLLKPDGTAVETGAEDQHL